VTSTPANRVKVECWNFQQEGAIWEPMVVLKTLKGVSRSLPNQYNKRGRHELASGLDKIC
jgi:hypothetical protein